MTSPDVDLYQMNQTSPLKKEVNPPLGISQSTAGLADILASRTASQGGYDSDAHTIASPLLKSNAGTIKVSAGYVKQALEKFELTSDGAASAPLPRTGTMDGHLSPAKSSPTHPRGQSSPLPTTPSKSTFTAALQLGTNESPTDGLRRLSVGIANGSIKAPGTPELRAMRLPSIKEVDSQWRLAAPERTSSLNQLDQDLNAKLKRLSDTVESAKRDSMVSINGNDHRTSLISELDPTLIDYMSRYANRISSEDTRDNGDHSNNTRCHSEVEQPLKIPSPSLHPGVKIGADAESKPDVNSLAKGDTDSIHLFNMRISQRLASQSQMHIQSLNTSNSASTRSLAPGSAVNLQTIGQGSITNISRYPTRIAPEHNRRPSDPQTRKLFESDTKHSKPDPYTWKTVTSIHSGSTSFDPKPKFGRFVGDDGSSFYFSDGEMGKSQVNSPLSGSRRSSLHNPHSLAVGGRSVSAGFGTGSMNKGTQYGWRDARLSSRRPSHDKSRASEDSWLAPGNVAQHGRSVSMPPKKEQTQQPSPTPVPKGLRGNTADAEHLSEMSLERVLDRRNEGLTEISAQNIFDKRNEMLSDIDHRLLTVPVTHLASPGNGHRNDRRERNSVGRSSASDDTGSRDGGNFAWDKAFRTAARGSRNNPAGGFLTAPKYDRDGRRRHSLKITTSDDGSVIRGRREGSMSDSRRSQSVGAARRSSAWPDLDAHQRLCSIAKVPLPRALPAVNLLDPKTGKYRSQTTKKKPKHRKKSVLELGRRFGSVALLSDEDKKSSTQTPIKDLLSIWSRFPSHTRAERNGSATDRDGVKVLDFLPSPTTNNALFQLNPTNKSPSNVTLLMSSAMKRLQTKTSRRLDKTKSKSMTLRAGTIMMLSPEEKARQGRKGVLGNWKRLYRTSSTELRKYTNARGHRSSFSVGDVPEYPELECLPGEGLFKETDLQRSPDLDGGTDSVSASDHALAREEATKAAALNDGKTKMRTDAAEWGKLYAECLGSLSALRSDDCDVMSLTLSDQFKEAPNTGKGNIASMELRQSTLDFQRQLGIDQEKAREDLLEKVGKIGKQDDGEWEDIPGDEQVQNHHTGDNKKTLDTTFQDVTYGSRTTKEIKVPSRFES